MFKVGFEKFAVSKAWVAKKTVGGIMTRAGYSRAGTSYKNAVSLAESRAKDGTSYLSSKLPTTRAGIGSLAKGTKNNPEAATSAMKKLENSRISLPEKN